jgi:MoaA/NifB/PqqE/SkfB family radical SAM enzyme
MFADGHAPNGAAACGIGGHIELILGRRLDIARRVHGAESAFELPMLSIDAQLQLSLLYRKLLNEDRADVFASRFVARENRAVPAVIIKPPPAQSERCVGADLPFGTEIEKVGISARVIVDGAALIRRQHGITAGRKPFREDAGGEPLMNPHMPEYIDYAARKGFYTSMPTNGLALKRYADACVKLDQLEVSIDTLDREKFAQRRGIDGLPTLLAALDYIKGNLKHNTIQINAAVDLENLEDLPALADYCEERGFLLHTEAVHNVVRTTWKTEDVEMRKSELDRVAAFVLALKKNHKCVRFYRDYFTFYRNDGFTRKFPCRSASHLINMRPDGSIQFPCAFVSLHRGAPEMSLGEIYASPEVRKIIQQSPLMWDFCKGCKIGCPYEVSAYRNSPFTAIRGAVDFFQLS